MVFLLSILRNRSLVSGAIQTLAFKISGAGLALLMFNQVALTLGELSFGQLAIGFNLASFIAVCAVFGQDTLIIRHLGEFGSGRNRARALGAYLYGWMVVCAAATLCVCLIGILIYADNSYRHDVFEPAVLGFIFMQALLHYASHACRTLVHFRLAEFCREIIWRLVVLVVLWFCVSHDAIYSSAVFFLSASLGMAIAILIEVFFIRRVTQKLWGIIKPDFDPLAWGKRSFGLWSSATLEAGSQYIDVVLVGILVHPVAAGGYFLAVRIANVFPMISSGLHTFLASRMAAHFYDGETRRLQESLKQVMIVAAIFILAIIFILIFFGSFILGLFGNEYKNMYSSLLILVFGTSIYALTGPHSMLLLTTGHEALYFNACFVTFIVRIIVLLLLVPMIGVSGCAIAWSGTVIPLGLFLVYLCKKHLNVDPSILACQTAFKNRV